MERTRAYDVVGDIAIVEIPSGSEKQAGAIAASILEMHKNIKVVLRKASERTGTHRTRTYTCLAGEDRTTTVDKESGCTFALDVAKSYFSVREATERLRIAGQVKDGERVLVMFAGVGPYAIVIAKKKNVELYAVEINPDAYESMVVNVRANRVMHRVYPILGDVRTVVPGLGLFDRVVMPLPQSAHEFLDTAIVATKKGGIVHFYSIEPEKDLFTEPVKQLTDAAKKQKRKLKTLNKHIVLPYAPRTYKVCVDAAIG